jgi:hypothetical protein
MFERSMMHRIIASSLFAVAVLASPSWAQGGGRGGAVAAQRCSGCDSAAAAGAARRSVESEISGLTIGLAENRILIEHLRNRLAEGSPDAPRSEKERSELQSQLVVRSRDMARLERELAALCGNASAVRGYMGVWISVSGEGQDSAGKSVLAYSYPIVTDVEPGSPAARAGIAAFDTIITINKLDARGRSFDAFVREPGDKVIVGLARPDGRRNVTVTIAPKPPTFGGSCLQYRSVVFANPTGQNIGSVRPAGARGTGTVAAGELRARSGGSRGAGGQGQPVRIQMNPDSMGQSATFFVVPEGAGASALFMTRGASGAIVAGAEVALINGGLRTVFAVDHGALVVNVAPRSPAEQAGIVSGDVIVSAQGDPVTAIQVLQRAIQAAGDRRSVTLDVVRAKQPQVITLRW